MLLIVDVFSSFELNTFICCHYSLFTSIALAEARDISVYLNPLQKHFTQIEETDFAEAKPLLEPLMHVICLIWSRSRYYCQSSKITVLLRQICNLLIHQVVRLLASGLAANENGFAQIVTVTGL